MEFFATVGTRLDRIYLTHRIKRPIILSVPAITPESQREIAMRIDEMTGLLHHYSSLAKIFEIIFGRPISRTERKRMDVTKRELGVQDVGITYYQDSDDFFRASLDEINSPYPVTQYRQIRFWVFAVDEECNLGRLNIVGVSNPYKEGEIDDQDYDRYVPGKPLDEALSTLPQVAYIVVLEKEVNSHIEHGDVDFPIGARTVLYRLSILTPSTEYTEYLYLLKDKAEAESSNDDDFGAWRADESGVWRDPTATGSFNSLSK